MMKKSVITLTAFAAVLLLLFSPVKVTAADIGSKAGVVSTKNTGLVVRSGPGTGYSAITSLAKGKYITLISNSGGWWYVEYDKAKFGYCSDKYITQISSVTKFVNTVSGNLNVRSGAGIDNKIVGSLKKGEKILELSSQNGWSRIIYSGSKVGFVSSDYLTSQTTANRKISLSVPDFKQNDSRWANVKVGSSGKTIAQIGCATTAISMMESFRQGRTILPDAMVKTLKYTPSGNVYWPSHYNVVTSTADYLNKIYGVLQSGNPVLFGAKNNYGKQHWVVITGFDGGNLTASGFTINDPGSGTRKNLAQFLKEYPTFYKYFHY